jgi:hypothetical protein
VWIADYFLSFAKRQRGMVTICTWVDMDSRKSEAASVAKDSQQPLTKLLTDSLVGARILYATLIIRYYAGYVDRSLADRTRLHSIFPQEGQRT